MDKKIQKGLVKVFPMSQLICTQCKTVYSANETRWRCDCGGMLDLNFKPEFDIKKIKSRKPGMWRYREAIPIESDEHIISLDEGFTPLVPFDFEGVRVWVKQDHLFPTGSYKDRGAAVLISKAKELGVREVVEDSSGNAGCAIAAYCAKADIRCQIYVPDSTSPGKTAQIQMYGAGLNLIPGSREDTSRAVLKAAEKQYYASHSWNPFFFHGTKTYAYEVVEQSGWQTPDTVVLPAGNGTLLLGAYIGFSELVEAGIIEKLPKLIAIQSQNCAPLAEAFEKGLTSNPAVDKKDTLAEGIAIADPVRGRQIVEAVKISGGMFITVSEEEIEQSLIQMCRQGAYIEPTSAATTAGVSKYLNHMQRDERIVTVFTGHGLKSTEKMLKIAAHH